MCRVQLLNGAYFDFYLHNKKRAFSFASFDSLRSSTTLFTQIYARKTHANT